MLSKIILIISLTTSLAASAATYKWVDENGVTQYGDTLPPQVINRGMTEMNTKGRVIKKVDPALTPEQIKAQQEEQAKLKEAAKQNELRRRHDQALIGTYTSEQEIDLARDRSVQQIDGTVRAAKERLTTLQSREKSLTKQIEESQGTDKSGKPQTPSKDLTDELNQTRKDLVALNAAISELQKQKEQVTARYDDDKLRFREIKEGKVDNAQTSVKVSKTDRITVPFVINDSSRALVNECLSRWSGAAPANTSHHAASGELVQIDNKTELVLDGRFQNKSGKFAPRRVVCPLTPDGKIDSQGVETKKALASLGARY